jgi:hypothetical protein
MLGGVMRRIEPLFEPVPKEPDRPERPAPSPPPRGTKPAPGPAPPVDLDVLDPTVHLIHPHGPGEPCLDLDGSPLYALRLPPPPTRAG